MAIQTGLRNRARQAAQRLLNALGKRLLAGRYTLAVPQFYRVYSPWFEPAFAALLNGPVSENTLLSEDRLYVLQNLVRHCAEHPGEMAECGVYKGGSAYLMAKTMSDAGTRVPLHLFDSFKGMPENVQVARDSHNPGYFGDSALEQVAALMKPFEFVELRPGFMPDTFLGLESRRFSFVHVDVDVYQSTLDCLSFFYPRLVPGGVLLFDDYGFRIYEHAEKRAVDEFFAQKREKPLVLQSAQALVVKL